MVEHPDRTDEKRSRKQLLALILGVAVASLAYRLATWTEYQHSAFVFVGVPTLLAVAVAMTPRAGTARGTIFRATTLRRALAIGYAFGFGQFLIALNWIATAFTYQSNMPARSHSVIAQPPASASKVETSRARPKRHAIPAASAG